MASPTLYSWIEQIVGGLIIATVLADVFCTVLYARAGSGIFTPALGRFTWKGLRAVSNLFRRRRDFALALCGPVLLVEPVVSWAMLLTLGTAMIVHPALGKSVVANGVAGGTDFWTAIYVGGNCMAFVGTSEYVPRTAVFHVFYWFGSLVGISIMTLTLTYLMQVYSALRHRNTVALKIHLASAETADAAEIIAALAPRGEFDQANGDLSEWAAELTQLKESHHFYPVLFYFRFEEPYYAVSRTLLVTLDLVTLLQSALDPERYGALRESVAVSQLYRASLALAETLTETFVEEIDTHNIAEPDQHVLGRWRARYERAVERLKRSRIATNPDLSAGFDAYVSYRCDWYRRIAELAPTMAYTMAEIDPATQSS